MTLTIHEDDHLAHYGILRRSGRYPWGSGETQSERNRSFLDHVDALRKEGFTPVEIVEALGLPSTTALRAAASIAKNEEKAADIARAQALKEKGLSTSAIGRAMGKNESTVRSLLAPGAKDKSDILETTANVLKAAVDKDGSYIQIGAGVENHMGVAKDKLNTAVARLREQGYEVHTVQVDQLGTRHKTGIKVLAPPGTTYPDIVQNMDRIRLINEHSEDGGRSFLGLLPPISVSSKRLKVNYAEDGGADADGVIYVRPGVKDLSMNGARYAQVRIAVDGSHYLKGMAMYKDDLPAGTDLVFNTNKKRADLGSDKLAALKPMKKNKDTDEIDEDNPFGSVVRQIGEKDTAGRLTKVTSALNLVNEEGDWDKWSRNFSSQMLSKQSPRLAEQQLRVTRENKRADLDEILALTNPAVRRKLLEAYADSADASAVHLKAAALPRSQSHVILPINSLKEGEIYAPNFRDGERVALVRYPHGGVFEIPELTVNNRHPEARRAIGPQAKDAVGINSKVAARLSGADFDGDTVMVIPHRGEIKTKPPLQGLKDFDPQSAYPGYPGMKKMDARVKGQQMGLVSNLITDMTIKGASDTELARAVRHSMVVIDAEKHGLNYKLSAERNGIPALMKKYQGRTAGGSSTLISRATARTDVAERKSTPKVNKDTGELEWTPTGKNWVNPQGKTVYATTRSQKLKETKDARTLVSDNGGTRIEHIYADHSNAMKALANEARKAAVNTQTIPYSPSAKKVYASEVASLNGKLNIALKNKPLERKAQLVANLNVQAKKDANPDMEKAEIKKLEGMALTEARQRVGASKQQIVIEPNEWAAIQAGAISNSKLGQILDNANIDKVKALATPRVERLMSPSKAARAAQMQASGYTQAEIADHLGVSLSTLKAGV